MPLRTRGLQPAEVQPGTMPPSLSEPVCELVADDLACRRGDRLVFTGLSFRLSAGGALLLRGTNGSGKTSLLRLLASLTAPARGRLIWNGAPVATDVAAYRAALSYVGHQDGVKPGLTPRETLEFWLRLRGSAAPGAALLDSALAEFALEPVADWPCRWLSAGQRRRLALAGLVGDRTVIWLLDEPTSALDQDGQLSLERAIAAHRAAGGLVVIATHTPIDVPSACTITINDFAPDPVHDIFDGR